VNKIGMFLVSETQARDPGAAWAIWMDRYLEFRNASFYQKY